MRQRRAGVAEGQARLQRGDGHGLAQRHVIRCAQQRRQRDQDAAGRRQRQGVRHRVGIAVPDRFERMRQRVQPALQRDRIRQAAHQHRVDDGGLGPGLGQMQRVLALLFAIPDRGPGRHLAAGAGGCRHRDEAAHRRRHEAFAVAQQPADLVELAARGAHQHGLGAVDHAAAAQRDDDLGRVLPDQRVKQFEVGQVGVGRDAVDDGGEAVADAQPQQLDEAQRAGLTEGQQHGPPLAQQFGQGGQRAQAGDGAHGVVENVHVSPRG
mmetsp:Transcript_9643/g.22536  ORF Transcript_9643/g.22536 Transcript_9643/m.22536 type:complete len:266 (-) Transcript_9643:1195-1992(-)